MDLGRGARRSSDPQFIVASKIGLVLNPGSQMYLFECYFLYNKDRKIIQYDNYQ